MEMFQVVVFCLASVVLLQFLRKEGHQGFAILLSIAAGISVFLYLINHLRALLEVFRHLTLGAGINFLFLDTLLKIIGIAYVAEFGAEICKDAGENMLASKIELAGKIFILFLSAPIFLLVLESILNFLP